MLVLSLLQTPTKRIYLVITQLFPLLSIVLICTGALVCGGCIALLPLSFYFLPEFPFFWVELVGIANACFWGVGASIVIFLVVLQFMQCAPSWHNALIVLDKDRNLAAFHRVIFSFCIVPPVTDDLDRLGTFQKQTDKRANLYLCAGDINICRFPRAVRRDFTSVEFTYMERFMQDLNAFVGGQSDTTYSPRIYGLKFTLFLQYFVEFERYPTSFLSGLLVILFGTAAFSLALAIPPILDIFFLYTNNLLVPLISNSEGLVKFLWVIAFIALMVGVSLLTVAGGVATVIVALYKWNASRDRRKETRRGKSRDDTPPGAASEGPQVASPWLHSERLAEPFLPTDVLHAKQAPSYFDFQSKEEQKMQFSALYVKGVDR